MQPKPGRTKNARMGSPDPPPAEAPGASASTLPMMDPLIPRAFCASVETRGSSHTWGLTALESNGTQQGHLAYCIHCLARIWIPS